MIKVGSDFSGVGAFNQALMRLGIEYKELFACDMDKYARQTFIHNYGEPEYYPTNVYEREIPSESLDIYMTSPPCQAFSLAGKRLGKDDKRAILFFNSYEFIQVNKPRYFIFENVKGLLSDDGGKTFQEWVNMLGGKSVNGVPVIFPYEESVPYHLYWKVLNAKNHGVPQNRERVFLIGIRDDNDNTFRFPIEEPLTKKLKDILEEEILKKFYLSDLAIEKCLKSEANKNMLVKEVSDISKCIVAGYYKIPFDGQYIKVESNLEKYFFSDKLMTWIDKHREKRGSSNKYPLDENDIGACVVARYGKNGAEDPYIKIGTWRTHKDGQGFREIEDGNCPTIPARAREDRSGQPVINDNYKIRRLTPRECFRLMDFPDTFTWTVSDSQAYKQAGNSIVVNVLYKILKNLNL
jgi:DNA (cytosine-5)-methyltransferase 1